MSSKSGSVSPPAIVKSPKKSPSADGSPKRALSRDKSPAKSPSREILSKKSRDKSPPKTSSYNPMRKNYDPITDAIWTKGQKVPYLGFAKTLSAIEETSGRLKMIEILSNYFRSVIALSPDDLLKSIYLCLNQIGPSYDNIELGVGESIIIKALAQATGRKTDMIKADIEKKGDIGIVAEESRSNQRLLFAPPKLTVSGVFDKFKEISQLTGHSMMAKKVEKIQSMIVACRECEARYLVRSLSGKLRIGLAEKSLLTALGQAFVLNEDNDVSRNSERFKSKVNKAVSILKKAYSECPNYDKIISVLINEGIEALPKHCQLTPHIPLKPMLAHPTKGVNEILKRFENSKVSCEYKYDGERAQIHYMGNDKVSIFSRNQENNTIKYPDIVSRVTSFTKSDVKSFILDTEAVAWDHETEDILPFQVLSTRKRKLVEESDIKIQVVIFAFDLLYFNGESLVKLPFRERRELLRENFLTVKGKFHFADSKDIENVEEINEFLDKAIKEKCEGLMVKALDDDATYEIAKRSHSWLKLKKDYLDGIGDTLDLVVIGGYYGKGKRTGVYGGYLLACYDEDSEEFQSICKIGTGFTDEDLDEHAKHFKDNTIKSPKKYYNFDNGSTPDVWFKPEKVWEVKCADLTISPVHRAAYGVIEKSKGISLRFPRFIRIREDKQPEDATTSTQVVDMYKQQQQINDKSKDEDDDDDYY